MANKVITVSGIQFNIITNAVVPVNRRGKDPVYLPVYEQMPVGAAVTLPENKAKGFYKAVQTVFPGEKRVSMYATEKPGEFMIYKKA
jgi:hypothetical protein